MATQLQDALAGKITPEMRKVAKKESVEVGKLRARRRHKPQFQAAFHARRSFGLRDRPRACAPSRAQPLCAVLGGGGFCASLVALAPARVAGEGDAVRGRS